MLQRVPMSAPPAAAKYVTKSNRLLPKVCGTRFFIAYGRAGVSDKNDRFWYLWYLMGFVALRRPMEATPIPTPQSVERLLVPRKVVMPCL
jgi:hypothetical protein